VDSLRTLGCLLGIALVISCSKGRARNQSTDGRGRTAETITLTVPAAENVRRFMRAEGHSAESALRVSVKHGGPTGFMYDLTFDRAARSGDVQSSSQGIAIRVDPESWPYLVGTVIDWDPEGGGFRFRNPNAK
jgi:iron-sulfur cluster assembly accessory protein